MVPLYNRERGNVFTRFPLLHDLTPETLKFFRVGQSGHFMTMPAFEEGILRGIKMRNINPCDPRQRFFQLEGSRLALFNHDYVFLRAGATFVVKGEIPVMLLHQHGLTACAPTGGEGSYKGQVAKWNTALALSAVVIIGDNDEPGRVLGKKRNMLFGGTLQFPPERFQDIDKWILADPIDALAALTQWGEKAKSEW